jgi:hypothetical protein
MRAITRGAFFYGADPLDIEIELGERDYKLGPTLPREARERTINQM